MGAVRTPERGVVTVADATATVEESRTGAMRAAGLVEMRTSRMHATHALGPSCPRALVQRSRRQARQLLSSTLLEVRSCVETALMEGTQPGEGRRWQARATNGRLVRC